MLAVRRPSNNTIFTILAVIVAIALRFVLDGEMGALAPFSPFYIAVVIGAWLGGIRPALLATGLSMAGYAVFFATPLYAAGLDDTLVAFVLNFAVCISIAFFGEAIHVEKRRAIAQNQRLQMAEERSSRAQRAARIGVWECDLLKGICYLSREFREIYGLGDDPVEFNAMTTLIHPDDRVAESERFNEVLARKEQEWISRSRFVHPELGTRWQFGRARIDYDADGTAQRISGTSMDVTEQQEAELLLRKSEERSSRAQEVARAGTWELDLLTQKAYLSAEFCRLLNKPYEPFVSIDEAFSVSNPDDQESLREDLYSAIARKERFYQTESRHVTSDGKEKWRLSRGEIQYDAKGNGISIVGATIDVTDRKVAELALQKSEERFRLATEAINGMVYDHDLSAGLVHRSDGLFELIGYTPAEAPMQENWWVSRIHPEDRENALPLMEMIIHQREPLFDLEYRVLHKNEHWVWVNDKGRLTYGDHSLLRIVGCTTDITIRKMAEVELQAADRRKDEFLATLAHELRNPLSPLQHAIDLLDDVADDRRMISELRAIMERQMKHLVRLVDDLLDLSRISRGKIELRRKEIDLVGCVKAAVEANTHLILRQEHELVLELPEAPCVIYGDNERLTQVISNLLHNAAKFTKPKGRIEIRLDKAQDKALIEIKDNGIGMDEAAIDKIFEMFVQAGTHVHSSGGLGIGLNLVRRLVVMHGGNVIAHSAGEGKGSTFQVRLPLLSASTDNVDTDTLVSSEVN